MFLKGTTSSSLSSDNNVCLCDNDPQRKIHTYDPLGEEFLNERRVIEIHLKARPHPEGSLPSGRL
jgi:hypothetical protein